MFRSFYVSFLLCLSLMFVGFHSYHAFAQENDAQPSVNLPSKDNFRIVVLAGQSNMAGRGFVEEEDRTPIPRVYMLDREGRWIPAVDPVHYDKPSAGVGPGRELARMLVESNSEIAVGLVPTACGGSSIDDWNPGVFFEQTKSRPYDDAIARTKRALEDGTLEAILWRQGESDATVEKANQYGEKLLRLFGNFRREFNASNVPILVGELALPGESKGAQAIRRAQLSVVERAQPAAFVLADGVVLDPDNIHFDRKSQLEQGRRFFYALEKIKREKTNASEN